MCSHPYLSGIRGSVSPPAGGRHPFVQRSRSTAQRPESSSSNSVVDPQTRLGEFAGRLDASEMRAVDVAPLALLALD